MNSTLDNIKFSLYEGGIGIGVPIGYLPKTNSVELYKVFQFAVDLNVFKRRYSFLKRTAVY